MEDDFLNYKNSDIFGNQDGLSGTKSDENNSESVPEEHNRNNNNSDNKSLIKTIAVIFAIANILIVSGMAIYFSRQMTYDIPYTSGNTQYRMVSGQDVMGNEDEFDREKVLGEINHRMVVERPNHNENGFSRRRNQAPKIMEGIFDDFGIPTKAFYMNGMQEITGYLHPDNRIYIANFNFQKDFELTKEYQLQWFRQVIDTLNKPGSSFFTFALDSDEANEISAEDLKNSGEDVFYYINGKRSDKKYLVSAQATGYGIGESLTLSLIEQ